MNSIAIFSVPRSGSSWLGEIFNSSPNTVYRFQPNFAYSFSPVLNQNSKTKEIDAFHQELIDCTDPFVCDKLSISGKQKEGFTKAEQNTLVWKETHFIFLAETLLKNSNTKVVGLVRSPFATVLSWLNAPKEFDPAWEVMEQWRFARLKNQGKPSHYFGFEKWKEATFLFEKLKKRYPDQFFLVEYDHLLNDTENITEELFAFSGLDVTPQTNDFLLASQSTTIDDTYGVFRKKTTDDQWKTDLPHKIINAIEEDLKDIELVKYLD